MTETELLDAYGMSDGSMTEAELLAGLTDALTLAGWRWTHIRRSDGVTMGMQGLPDLIAVHPTRSIVLAWELKRDKGVPTPDQTAWIHGFRMADTISSRIVRPADYDDALALILNTSTAVVRAHRIGGVR